MTDPRIAEAWEVLYRHPRGRVAIDTETSGLGLANGDVIRGVSMAVEAPGMPAWYFPVSHPQSENIDRWHVHALVWHVLRDRDVTFHHWKYDAKALEQLGCPPTLPAWDTMCGSWCEDENKPSHELKVLGRTVDSHAADEKKAIQELRKGPGLKALEDDIYVAAGGCITRKTAHQYALVDPRWRHHEGENGKLISGWTEEQFWRLVPAHELEAYAIQDARLTLKLRMVQQTLADGPRPDIKVAMPRELAWQDSLRKMEVAGIRVNHETAERLRQTAALRRDKIASAMRRNFGVDLGVKATGDNIAELIYGTWGHRCVHFTDGGARSTKAEALDELMYDPRVALLAEYRRLGTAILSYYDPLISRLDDEGRVHPSFNAERITRTSRLATSAPNLQTIPHEGSHIEEVRQVFCAAPGYELWEYDLSQAELRWAAAVSHDEAMLAIFREGRDLYQEVADEAVCRARGCAKTKGRCARHRQLYKRVCLSYQYGVGAEKLGKIVAAEERQLLGRMVRPDPGKATTMIVGFERMFPQLKRSIAFYEEWARTERRIPLGPPGRYRTFWTCPPGQAIWEQYRKAFNSACQGGVACFMANVQMAAEDAVAGMGARFVLQVHDSLVAEVPPGLGEKLGLILQEVADSLNPFPSVRQVFEAKPWG